MADSLLPVTSGLDPDQVIDEEEEEENSSSTVGKAIKIGRYVLGKRLGVGTFGKVKLATHELTGHQVAVKILNKSRITTLAMDDKIKREIAIMKMFWHPHIIRLYEVIDTDTDIFMVMELVVGGEMFQYIADNGRLPEDEARRFFQQIISGVDYCHRHGVVHRDLKPENILIDMQHNIRIADFGLSNMMTDGDFLTTSCGSPNYAAPEVIAGKMYAGPDVDVWSCGVILYALLCGRLPFDDDYIPSLFKKIRGGIYSLPGFLSAPARDLITSMLVVDPTRRISIDEVRNHPWFLPNLPDYIANSWEEGDKTITHVDADVLAELMERLSFNHEQALAQLTAGGTNEAVVAYHLIKDHRDRLWAEEQAAAYEAELEANGGVPPPATTAVMEEPPTPDLGETPPRPPDGTKPTPPSINVMSTPVGIPSRTGAAAGTASIISGTPDLAATPGTIASLNQQLASRAGQMSPLTPNRTSPFYSSFRRIKRAPVPWKRRGVASNADGKTIWKLGVESTESPQELMNHVYNALKEKGWQWSTVSTFVVRARWRDEDGSKESELKTMIRLYKVEPGRYLLDFQKLPGPLFQFFDKIYEVMALLHRTFGVEGISTS